MNVISIYEWLVTEVCYHVAGARSAEDGGGGRWEGVLLAAPNTGI